MCSCAVSDRFLSLGLQHGARLVAVSWRWMTSHPAPFRQVECTGRKQHREPEHAARSSTFVYTVDRQCSLLRDLLWRWGGNMKNDKKIPCMNLIPDLDTVLAKITVISRDSQNNVTPEISVLMGGKKNLLQDEIVEYFITKGRIWVVFIFMYY